MKQEPFRILGDVKKTHGLRLESEFLELRYRCFQAIDYSHSEDQISLLKLTDKAQLFPFESSTEQIYDAGVVGEKQLLPLNKDEAAVYFEF